MHKSAMIQIALGLGKGFLSDFFGIDSRPLAIFTSINYKGMILRTLQVRMDAFTERALLGLRRRTTRRIATNGAPIMSTKNTIFSLPTERQKLLYKHCMIQ
jgi:hypothetical protein